MNDRFKKFLIKEGLTSSEDLQDDSMLTDEELEQIITVLTNKILGDRIGWRANTGPSYLDKLVTKLRRMKTGTSAGSKSLHKSWDDDNKLDSGE